MSIACKNLSKNFGKKKALQDVSLQIADGKVTGIVGPNGAGKSTLIKLLTGLIYPSAGYAAIDGWDVHTERLEALKHLGAIVEWPSFYPDLTARQNLAILSGGRGKAYEEKLKSVTEFLNIHEILDRKAGELSTGTKQRLGIAFTLLPDSKYVILDEPTNGLDPNGIVEIRNLIRDCNRKSGVTIIVSSHLLSEIEMICDELVMIVDGKLKAAGNLKELLARGRRIKVVTTTPEKTSVFLKKAFENKELWINSPPRCDGEGFSFLIPENCDPAVVSGKLFQAGFAISHFAGEQLTLEDFFLKNAAGDEQ
jgi:ABC-2 type transport system ATP-binding protein